jgi:hypothetical protein
LKKQIISLFTLIIAVGLAIGCGSQGTSIGSSSNGGSGTPGGGGTPAVAKAVIGFHVGHGQEANGSIQVHRTTTTAMTTMPGMFKYLATFVQVPQADATTGTSPTITMSFSGFCDGVNAPQLGQEIVVYGIGSTSSSMCETRYLGIADAPNSPVVVGDGTLQVLRIYAHGSNATPNAATIKIYVNGSLTPLTCMTNASNKCANDTSTVPVKDGDLVTATITIDPNVSPATITGFRIMLGKQ